MSYQGNGLPTLGVAQSRMFHCTAPRLVSVSARRLGKTTYAGVRLFHSAYTIERAECRYIAPTYKQAKEIFWKPLKRIVPACYVAKINEGDLSVTLLNESTIKLLGAENYDSLRGPGLNDVVFDEFADIAKEAWEEVIEPTLADREGRAAFLGTPKGYDHFHDLYQLGLVKSQEEWRSFHFTTAQGGRVKRSIIDRARATLDIRVFRQEYEASFETLSGRVYDNFDRAPWPKGNCYERVVDRGGEVLVGLDFNINPMSAVIGQDVEGLPEIFDELVLHTSNTEEMAQALRTKFGERRPITVCPDASGKQRHTNAPMGQTDFTILARYGMKILSKNVNPVIVDRVNNVQCVLKSGTGVRRVRIHPRCKNLIKGLEGLTWKESASGQSTNQIDKTMGLDHITDAFGYLLWQKFNILHAILRPSTPSGSALVSPTGFLIPNSEAA